MTKPAPKRSRQTHAEPGVSGSELCITVEQTPDRVRAILWGIASDSEESGTARVAACCLLLADASERDEGGELHHDADLNKRAIALMRRVAN